MRKSIQLIGLLLFMVAMSVSANGVQKESLSKDVKVYYFHATARCVTCKAVEAVTQKSLNDLYGEKIPFIVIDREKDKENPLLKKYKVTGQTLIVVSGDKVVDLTNDAFLNARTKPEQLTKKIKSTVNEMLK